MTTPKRYEEMAAKLMDTLTVAVYNESHHDYDADRRTLSEALRTAAREAQVRVLEELEGRIDGYEVVFDSIRERIENGEDL